MISEKINEALRYFKNGIFLLNEILAECDAENDIASLRRSRFRFVEDDPNVLSFPGTQKSPFQTEEADFLENPDGGEPSEGSEQGFVEFTEKEIMTMPKNLRQLIIVNRKRCRMRRRPCGDGYTYEIRFRAQGYNLSASGKTKALAKANMLEKLKKAKPQKKEDPSAVPTTFNAFATYYFENFRKPKVAEQTYNFDLRRYRNYLQKHFAETPIPKILPADCKTLLDSVRADGKGKTADELHSLLSIIFKGAIAHGIIQRNPLDTVFHVQHERQNGSAVPLAEQERLIEEVKGTVYQHAVALALFCGLRPGELKSAVIEGDFVKTVNTKRKTKRTEYKRIYICKRLRALLPADGKIYISDLNKLRAKVRTVLPGYKLYDLRITFNTRCKELDVSEHARAHFMGHSLGAIGNAYTDLSDGYLLKEGKKLDEW